LCKTVLGPISCTFGRKMLKIKVVKNHERLPTRLIASN